MLAAAVVGIFIIPALYFVFQSARERIKALISNPPRYRHLIDRVARRRRAGHWRVKVSLAFAR